MHLIEQRSLSMTLRVQKKKHKKKQKKSTMERAFQKFQNVTWSKNLDFVFSSFFSWVTSNLKGFLCSENHSTHETEKHFRLEKICF